MHHKNKEQHMRTEKTIRKNLQEWIKRQSDFEAKYGYNDGHDHKDIIRTLKWVLNEQDN